MSRMQLAARSGVSYRQLINILAHGQKPQAETAEKLAAALSCSSDWLLFGTGPRGPERTTVREPKPTWGSKGPHELSAPAGQEKLIEAVATIAAQTGLPRDRIVDVLCDELKRKIREEIHEKEKAG